MLPLQFRVLKYQPQKNIVKVFKNIEHLLQDMCLFWFNVVYSSFVDGVYKSLQTAVKPQADIAGTTH